MSEHTIKAIASIIYDLKYRVIVIVYLLHTLSDYPYQLI